MTVAFVFPGQGSQSVGMLAGLAASDALVIETFAEASAVLGYDLWQLCQQGPEEALGVTEKTQPAMLAAGVATWRVWRSRGGALPAAMSGHSLGEYSALVAAGCLDFRTAIDLVRFRGAAMQAAVPAGQGAMAAILGLEDADVEAACRAAAQGDIVEAANFNSPGQVVIAGQAAAVDRAIEVAKEKGAKRAIKLGVSVPSHSSLMRPAAEQLAARLKQTALRAPQGIEIYSVDLRRHTDPDGIRAALVDQLVKPVRWADTVRAMLGSGVRTIVECGPGKVLTGLNRRIERDKAVRMIALEDAASVAEALDASTQA
ncbi:MAG: ACP S-malonyltransferase [Steroidobacteraceae bacterium]